MNVVSLQYNFEDMGRHTKYHKPSPPKGTFAELEKRGIKIKNYQERGGDGHII